MASSTAAEVSSLPADAAAAAKPVTLADLKTFGESIVEATTTKVREEVIEEVRRSGGITRRGLVAQARAIGESKVESDPKKLAEMSDEDFSKAIIDTFDPLLGGRKKKTLMQVLKRPLPKLRATKRDGDHGLGKRL